MIFGKTGFRCKLAQANFSAKAGTEDIHSAGKSFIELNACGLPDRWQIVDNFGNVAVLLQMIGQQRSQLFFKTELVASCSLMRSQDRPDQGVEGRIPTVQLVEE